jgi:hypothetical protein
VLRRVTRTSNYCGVVVGFLGRPEHAAAQDQTEVLDPAAASALADPGAVTRAIPRPAGALPDQPGPGPGAAANQGRPFVVSRRVAAEIGMYVGFGLILLALGGVAARGWAGWDDAMRWAIVALASVALLATGLFVRLPWTRALGDERRRAVSSMLALGSGLALLAAAIGLGVGRGGEGPALAHGLGSVVAMLLVCVVARTPLAETALLAAAAWAAWLVVPAGPAIWVVLVGLGAAWALAGTRCARGRRTAAVAGTGLALVASVGLAAGPWAWWARAGLIALTIGGLGAFLRGHANHWLALGAGAATALAASVAGATLGPALALLVGGLATMAVSGIALRSARRSG